MSTPAEDRGWYVPPIEPVAAPSPTSPARIPHAAPPELHRPPAPYPAPRPGGRAPSPEPWAPPSWGPPSVRLATPVARLGALLLDLVLMMVTLFVGWLVWSLVVWNRGATPAKSLLRQRVVDARTGSTATWGRMAVRQLLVGGLLTWVLDAVTLMLFSLIDALMVFSGGHRRLTDRIASTLVVQD